MRLVLCLTMLASGPAAKAAQQPGPDAAADSIPASRARMYAVDSAKAWAAARALVAELGLKADKTAAAEQFLATKWAPFRSKQRPDLAVFSTPSGLESEDFQLHVFVSPFAEPARVYLGSVVQFTGRPRPDGPVQHSVAYSSGQVEDWFFAQLERKLGEAGRPIPTALGARGELARTLLGDRAGPCLSPSRPKGDLAPPEKIKESVVEVVYPPAEREAWHQALVVTQSTVSEDGGVFGERILGEAPPPQFQVSVLGAVSLLRYRPTRLGACPAPAITTYTVNYKLR
jgi:hypothetical protein